MPEPILFCWSGGKDSAMALHALQQSPDVQIVALLTTVTETYDRISMHGVRRALLHAQGRALGLPIHEITLEPSCSNAAYEAAFHAGLLAAQTRHPGLTGIAFGDLFLEDVRAYRERLLAGTGLRPIFPIWGQPTSSLAKRCISLGIAARVVCVDTTQLGGEFAGRLYDHALLADLPRSVDPCGERGEFHTFVSDGPGFHGSVDYRVGERVRRDDRFMYCDLVPAG